MKTITLDLKSCLVGLVIGVLAVVLIGAETSQPQQIGRYQVVTFNAGGQTSSMMIDTTTGKAWCANLATTWKNDGGLLFEPKEGK